jgi:hypothetical protein
MEVIYKFDLSYGKTSHLKDDYPVSDAPKSSNASRRKLKVSIVQNGEVEFRRMLVQILKYLYRIHGTYCL